MEARTAPGSAPSSRVMNSPLGEASTCSGSVGAAVVREPVAAATSGVT